jgi:hypothetical protein
MVTYSKWLWGENDQPILEEDGCTLQQAADWLTLGTDDVEWAIEQQGQCDGEVGTLPVWGTVTEDGDTPNYVIP